MATPASSINCRDDEPQTYKLQAFETKPPTLNALKNLISQPSMPVKKVVPQPTTQQDHLTDKQIAQILYNKAKHDTFNGTGRIILGEARDIADNKHMQIADVLIFWQQHYPLIEAETKSNIVLVYWKGKLDRSIIPPIIPKKAPVFKPQENTTGDIFEDEDGVVPEEA